MKTVRIKNITIGEGRPKICVPIVSPIKEKIIQQASLLASHTADLVEWRADWYQDVDDIEKTLDTLREVSYALEDIPLLFTFRTKKEGGKRELSADLYEKLNLAVIASGNADLIDVELFTGDAIVKNLVKTAHANNVKVIASSHDFEKTPPQEEIISRLRTMQNLGADLPKIAVMPNSKQDVLTLLSATLEMNEHYADRPIITMSMSGTGLISRLAGECFGSALTFGAVGRVSAPGQIQSSDLKQVLEIIHYSL